MASKQYENAASLLDRFVLSNPQHLEARFLQAVLKLCRTHVDTKQSIVEARDLLLNIVNDFPEVKMNITSTLNFNIMFQLAESCYVVGPKKLAFDIYMDLQKISADPKLLYRLCEMLAQANAPYEKIKQTLVVALNRDPKKFKVSKEIIKNLESRSTISAADIIKLKNISGEQHASVYDGVAVLKFPDQPHLGGNALEGDPASFSPNTWDYLIDRFCVTSVLDLGSGLGHAAEYFHRRKTKSCCGRGR